MVTIVSNLLPPNLTQTFKTFSSWHGQLKIKTLTVNEANTTALQFSLIAVALFKGAGNRRSTAPLNFGQSVKCRKISFLQKKFHPKMQNVGLTAPPQISVIQTQNCNSEHLQSSLSKVCSWGMQTFCTSIFTDAESHVKRKVMMNIQQNMNNISDFCYQH